LDLTYENEKLIKKEKLNLKTFENATLIKKTEVKTNLLVHINYLLNKYYIKIIVSRNACLNEYIVY
jgi:hypothetical protein